MVGNIEIAIENLFFEVHVVLIHVFGKFVKRGLFLSTIISKEEVIYLSDIYACIQRQMWALSVFKMKGEKKNRLLYR